MAGKVRHLLHARGRYFARLAVPIALRPIVGKRELLKSLGPDRTIALRKLPAAVAEMQATLETARANREMPPRAAPRGRPLTPQQMAKQHYSECVALDAEIRLTGRPYAGEPFDDLYVAALRRAKAGAADDNELIETVGAVVEHFRRAGNTHVAVGTPEFRELAKALAIAEYEAIAVAAERDEGNDTAATKHPLLVIPEVGNSATSSRILGPDSTKSLGELLVLFSGEKGSRPGTTYEYQVAVRMFEEFLGEPRPAHAITRQDVLDYKRALMDTPSNYTKRFPDTLLPQAIKLNKARAAPFPTLNATTINDKWLARLHSILKWCVNNNVIPDNPVSGIKVDQVKATSAPRVPFTPGDLTKIFAPPLFAQAKPFGEREWMTLIALFTGFRASEIAQLKLDSVRHERGILAFAVEEETKTRGSLRVTPVHSTLSRLGLEKRVAELRKARETHLFPDWYHRGQALLTSSQARKVNQPYSQFLPRWFNRTYLPSVGINDDRKVFHSFRHTLKTALARAGVPRSVSDDITGHDDRTAGAKYVHETSIEAMKQAIERIHLDGFPL